MLRKRSVSYTAFNIRTHPHSPETYVQLIERAFDLRRPVNLRGDTYAIMTEVSPIGQNPLEGFAGEIAKYTRIESGRWFNLQELRAADEDETRRINIPEELRPNFTSFSFAFYPRNHFLVIECKDSSGSISPRNIEKYFRRIFDQEEIVEEFNTVELTLVPRADQLESIFALPSINQIELIIRRPNTDDFDDLEEEILERLNNQNIEEEKIILKAQPGLSIEADDTTLGLSHVAQLNGQVNAVGHDDAGKRVEKSTKQHPFIETGQYQPGEITQKDFLYVMANRVIDKIRTMRRPSIRNG